MLRLMLGLVVQYGLLEHQRLLSRARVSTGRAPDCGRGIKGIPCGNRRSFLLQMKIQKLSRDNMEYCVILVTIDPIRSELLRK